MEKCAWCGRKLKGEIIETPAYHSECKQRQSRYLGAARQLKDSCGRLSLAAYPIEAVGSGVEGDLLKVKAEMEKVSELLSECLSLFATRNSGK